MPLADPRALVLLPLKVRTMHEMRFNNSMGTIGKEEHSKFAKTDTPTPAVAFRAVKVDKAALVEDSLLEVDMAAVVVAMA